MDDEDQDERGLEETLEKLGFGAYHWRLLALCGFGWMSDNSALQCIGEKGMAKKPTQLKQQPSFCPEYRYIST
jgi:hypothetical protein